MHARGREKLRRAIGHLRRAADKLETADEREPLLLSCSVMAFILDGWHICPWRAAFVYRYGRHPEYVIPFWLRRAAEHRTTAMPLVVVPDYDPTLQPASEMGRRPTQQGALHPLSPKEGPVLPKSVLPMPLPRTGTK